VAEGALAPIINLLRVPNEDLQEHAAGATLSLSLPLPSSLSPSLVVCRQVGHTDIYIPSSFYHFPVIHTSMNPHPQTLNPQVQDQTSDHTQRIAQFAVDALQSPPTFFFFFITLGLELSDTKVHEP